jgi:hypothetical protein
VGWGAVGNDHGGGEHDQTQVESQDL